MSKWVVGLASLAVCGLVPSAGAQESVSASLARIGVKDAPKPIQTIRTEAHVTVSDGLEFDVVTVFHDHQRAVFHRIYSDRTATLGVDGKYYWSFDGEKEEEAPALFESIVMGHQFHAQILFFDELNGPVGASTRVQCAGTPCDSYGGALHRTLRVDARNGRPLELTLARDDASDIEIVFDGWRDVDGITLPFRLVLDDGERVFEYVFGSVTFNEGSVASLRAPMELLTDEQKLLRLHRIAMDAHLFGDAGMFEGLFADGVVASEGEIYRTKGDDVEAMLKRILSNRNYTRYDDLIRPIVRTSEDGSLGWVVVQVSANGVRLDEEGEPSGPLKFISAWISLFEKTADVWKQIGNVSNFKPGRE